MGKDVVGAAVGAKVGSVFLLESRLSLISFLFTYGLSSK